MMVATSEGTTQNNHDVDDLREVQLNNEVTIEDSSNNSDIPMSYDRYEPYSKAKLETPLMHFVNGEGFPPKFYAFRWALAYPLQQRMPGCLNGWTYGEMILLMPWMFFLWLSTEAVFLEPSVERSGFVAGMPLAFMYLTASRTNSLFSFLLGIPFERMIFYHKVSAYVSFVSGALHAYVAYAVEEAFDDRRRLFTDVETHREMHSGDSGDFNEGNNYALFGPEPNLYKFATTGNTNLSGTMIILSYAIIFMTSYVFVRRVAFEFFLFMHLIFAGVCLYYGLEHGVNLFIIVIFWALDVLVRILLMGIGDRGKQTASIRLLPGNIVELQFQKSKCFQYNAGQYVFLCIPKLSHLQWHPFSISSSPNQEYVSIHVKGLGGWTNSLVQLARDGVEEVQVLFDGPYGAPKLDLNSNRYKVVILFSGGIGATPMFSLCNDLLHKKKLGRDIQKIIFVWSSRKQTTDASFDAEAGSVALPRAFTPNLFVDPPDGIVVRSNPTTSYLDTTGLLFSECYMTGTKGDTELILPGVTFGRPNLNPIFSRAVEVAEDLGERRVAVCVCGPNSLVKSVTSAAKGHSGYGVYFDVHSELFEF